MGTKPHTSIVQTKEAVGELLLARSLEALISWMEEEEIHEITLPKLRDLHVALIKQIGHVEERA